MFLILANFSPVTLIFSSDLSISFASQTLWFRMFLNYAYFRELEILSLLIELAKLLDIDDRHYRDFLTLGLDSLTLILPQSFFSYADIILILLFFVSILLQADLILNYFIPVDLSMLLDTVQFGSPAVFVLSFITGLLEVEWYPSSSVIELFMVSY